MPGTRPGTGVRCDGDPGPLTSGLRLRAGALPAPLRFELRLAPCGAFRGSGVAIAGGCHGSVISIGDAQAPDFAKRGVKQRNLTPPLRMAPRDGFEPSTQRLTAACSTTELPGITARPDRKAAAGWGLK